MKNWAWQPECLAVLGALTLACGTSHDAKGDGSGGASSGGSKATGSAGQGGSKTNPGGGGSSGGPIAGHSGSSANVAGSAGTGAGGSGAAGEPPLGAFSYTTKFDLTESTLSEGGKWKNTGLDWTMVETKDGHAFGTQTGTDGFNDSYAYLSGFPPNQRGSGIIHKSATFTGTCTREVEILLRWSDAAHDAHGYEVNLAYDGGYTEIVRWNGALGSYDYLKRSSVPGGVKDGDTLDVSIVGNLIIVKVNGVEVNRATDETFKTGNPGIAFWRGGPCGVRGDYGFSEFTASSIE